MLDPKLLVIAIALVVGAVACTALYLISRVLMTTRPPADGDVPAPCPFCGSSAEVAEYGVVEGYRHDGMVVYVICQRGACRLMGPSQPTRAEAISSWNSILVCR